MSDFFEQVQTAMKKNIDTSDIFNQFMSTFDARKAVLEGIEENCLYGFPHKQSVHLLLPYELHMEHDNYHKSMIVSRAKEQINDSRFTVEIMKDSVGPKFIVIYW